MWVCEIRADAVDIGSVVVVRIAIAVDIGEVGGNKAALMSDYMIAEAGRTPWTKEALR